MSNESGLTQKERKSVITLAAPDGERVAFPLGKAIATYMSCGHAIAALPYGSANAEFSRLLPCT